MTLKELQIQIDAIQAHKTRITNLETMVNKLADATTEINIAINIIMTYVCARDHLMIDDPHEYLFDWIVTNVDKNQLFNGTMTDLHRQSGFKFYKVPQMGRILKTIRPKLEKSGFEFTEKNKKGSFQIYKV